MGFLSKLASFGIGLLTSEAVGALLPAPARAIAGVTGELLGVGPERAVKPALRPGKKVLRSLQGDPASVSILPPARRITAATVLGPASVAAPPITRATLAAASGVASMGNAQNFRQTIVQTIDRATGRVIREEIHKGSPFLMNTDIVRAKRVARLVSKAHARLPRRTVKQSAMSAANEALQNRMLAQITCPPTPQKC